jgi:hypothetical protein
VRPDSFGAEPAKVMVSPEVPVPPCPVGWPSGWRTLMVKTCRVMVPAVVLTAGRIRRRASTDMEVLPAVARSPIHAVTV